MMQRANRSTFVTVVAWIFIVLAGFTTFIAILQNIMISLMFSGGHMGEALNQTETQDVP
jgi:hypothetical protein